MKSADIILKGELSRINNLLKNTLKDCIITVSKTYFKYMYSDPVLSDLAKSVIDGLKQELKELENESRKCQADKGILIQYP
jgi:hypothetical protein